MFLYSRHLSELTGASRKALRLYEEHGLLTKVERDWNGWRVYTVEHLLRVATIKLLQDSGLTLSEISRICADSQASHPWDLAEERLTARIAQAQHNLDVLRKLKASRMQSSDLPLYSPNVRELLNTMIARGYPTDMAFRSGRILQFLYITLTPEQWQAVHTLAHSRLADMDDQLIELAQEFVDLANLPVDSPRISAWRDRVLAYSVDHPGVIDTDFTALGIEHTADNVLFDLWTHGLTPAQLRASAMLDEIAQRN